MLFRRAKIPLVPHGANGRKVHRPHVGRNDAQPVRLEHFELELKNGTPYQVPQWC